MEKDPSRPFLLLGDIVQEYGHTDVRPFRMVKCRTQEAYGCGKNGDAIVRGLALFVRLGRDDDKDKSPKLCISASSEVFHFVGLEIDDHKAMLYGRQLRIAARIHTVDGNVMVIGISFIASFSSNYFRTYYLVYDSAAASLSLLPHLPPSCSDAYTESDPLVLRVGVEQDNKYSLVLMAERSVCTSPKHTHPVICLWSPPPPSPDDNRLDYSSKTPWELKGRQGADAFPNRFKANVVFLLNGNIAVWGDLSQGIMYCHCSDLIDGTDPVDFKHIMLPEECRISEEDMDLLDHCSLVVHRTMGCVGDSIWFVIIEPNFTCPGDTMVKVWTLDLLQEEEEWNPHREFKMLELFKAQGHHPETVPKFPFIRQQADCALHMLLPDPYKGDRKAYCDLMCIDLRCSMCEARIQSNRRLSTPLMNQPVVMDLDFFNSLGHCY